MDVEILPPSKLTCHTDSSSHFDGSIKKCVRNVTLKFQKHCCLSTLSVNVTVPLGTSRTACSVVYCTNLDKLEVSKKIFSRRNTAKRRRAVAVKRTATNFDSIQNHFLKLLTILESL